MQRGCAITLPASWNSAIARARSSAITAKAVTGRSAFAATTDGKACCPLVSSSTGSIAHATPRASVAAAVRLHRPRRIVDGGPDADIGGAAAEVAVHGAIDVAVARLLDRLQQRHRAHHLPRLAVTTLRNVARDPGALHRLALTSGKTLDGRYLGLADRRHRKRAGAQRLAIKEDSAGTALGNPASELGAGEAEIFAKDPQQRRVVGRVHGMGPTVDLELECHRRLSVSSTPTPD